MAANRQEATSLLVEEREQVILPAKFVDSVANDDADDAVEWSASFQWRIVALLALAAFTVYVGRSAAARTPTCSVAGN